MSESALTLTLPPEALEAVADLVAQRVLVRLGDREPEGWMNVEQAATYLSCPRSRIHDLVALSRLQCARDGRRLLFQRAWLDEALEGSK